MAHKVKFGAPSLTGAGVNKLVADEFGKVKFPLKVKVTNHPPRTVVFPEITGVVLAHCASATGSVKEVEIQSLDHLQRLASSTEQVAELNGYALFLTIEEVDAAPAPKASKAAPAAPATT